MTIEATHSAGSLTDQGIYYAGALISVSDVTTIAEGETGVGFTGRYWGSLEQVRLDKVEMTSASNCQSVTADNNGWKSGISSFYLDTGNGVATWSMKSERDEESQLGFARKQEDQLKLYMNTANDDTEINFDEGVDISSWQTDNACLLYTSPSPRD